MRLVAIIVGESPGTHLDAGCDRSIAVSGRRARSGAGTGSSMVGAFYVMAPALVSLPAVLRVQETAGRLLRTD